MLYLIPGYNMPRVIPAKLDNALVEQVDRLVSEGLYVSRSEAIRNGVRRLISERYVSVSAMLRMIAEAAAELIIRRIGSVVTDVILFGSVARSGAGLESDIDLFVLLKGKGEEAGEYETLMHEEVYPLALAAKTVISVIAVDREDFISWFKAGSHFAEEIVGSGIQLRGRLLSELGKPRVP